MFHKISSVIALQDYRLRIQFEEDLVKIYDVKPLFVKWVPFRALENDPELFSDVKIDMGGYGIIWNDNLDLSCDELFANGQVIEETNLNEPNKITYASMESAEKGEDTHGPFGSVSALMDSLKA